MWTSQHPTLGTSDVFPMTSRERITPSPQCQVLLRRGSYPALQAHPAQSPHTLWFPPASPGSSCAAPSHTMSSHTEVLVLSQDHHSVASGLHTRYSFCLPPCLHLSLHRTVTSHPFKAEPSSPSLPPGCLPDPSLCTHRPLCSPHPYSYHTACSPSVSVCIPDMNPTGKGPSHLFPSVEVVLSLTSRKCSINEH